MRALDSFRRLIASGWIFQTVIDGSAPMCITKQAVGKSLLTLEERGYVARKPDGDDKRARIIAFTPTGEDLIAKAIAVIQGIERRYGRLVGRKELRHLKQTLRLLFLDHQERKS